MTVDQNKAKTMRIDLIPDVPMVPQGRRPIRVIKPASDTRAKPPENTTKTREGEVYDKYHELLNAIYDAALITDLNGIICEVNARAVEFLLWSDEELEGASIIDVISGAGDDLIDMLVANLKHERHTLIQAYCLRKNGSKFPAEIAVNRIKSIGGGGLCFFIRDITVRRQAEEMLRTEHNAIRNSANGIAVADLDACFEYANPAFANMLGYDDAQSLVGADVRKVLGESVETEEMIEQVLERGETWQGEMEVELSSGASLSLEVLATCNKNTNGDTVGIVFSFSDLTDRNRAEEAMRKAEQQRVMLESLGAACHHLGQPATVLSVSIGGIQAHLDTEDKLVKELVEKSVKASERLGTVLHKLNEVNVYRTTSYLTNNTQNSKTPSSRIIDI